MFLKRSGIELKRTKIYNDRFCFTVLETVAHCENCKLLKINEKYIATIRVGFELGANKLDIEN